MSFPDGTWFATVSGGVVTAQYLILTSDGTPRTYNITPHEIFKQFLLDEIRMTQQGYVALFPAPDDRDMRTGLVKAKGKEANVRRNPNTDAEIIHVLKGIEIPVRYIPVEKLPARPEIHRVDTKQDNSTATWIPMYMPVEGEVLQAWVRDDVVDIQPTSEDDAPAAPVEPTPETDIPAPPTAVEQPPEPPKPYEPPLTPDRAPVDMQQDIDVLNILIKEAENEKSKINHELVKVHDRLKLLESVRDDLLRVIGKEEIAA